MPRTVRGEIAAERRLGTPESIPFEEESFEAQAILLRMFIYMRALHPEIARQHGYEV